VSVELPGGMLEFENIAVDERDMVTVWREDPPAGSLFGRLRKWATAFTVIASGGTPVIAPMMIAPVKGAQAQVTQPFLVITFAGGKIYQRTLEGTDSDRARLFCAKFNARAGQL
jgi:aminoglycoside phosphotransferase (APT) family kinase protein